MPWIELEGGADVWLFKDLFAVCAVTGGVFCVGRFDFDLSVDNVSERC